MATNSKWLNALPVKSRSSSPSPDKNSKDADACSPSVPTASGASTFDDSQIKNSTERSSSSAKQDQPRPANSAYEQTKNKSISGLPAPTSSVTNAQLRWSSTRIPAQNYEKRVALPPAIDAGIPNQMTSPEDGDKPTSNTLPYGCREFKQHGPDSGGLCTKTLDSRKDQEGGDVENETLETPDEPLFTPTATAPDSRQGFFGHPDPTPIRHLASKSGFSAAMDTIRERSAEFASVQTNSCLASMSSIKTAQPSSGEVDVPPPLPAPIPIPPPLPCAPPAPAAPVAPVVPGTVVEQSSTDNLSFEAHLRAISPYLNTISPESLSMRTSSRPSVRLHPQESSQSINSVSSLSSSLSSNPSVQELLGLELLTARGILTSLPQRQLPDNVIGTSSFFTPVATRSESKRTASDEGRQIDTALGTKTASDDESGQSKAKIARMAEFLHEVDKAKEGIDLQTDPLKIFASGDPSSFSTPRDEATGDRPPARPIHWSRSASRSSRLPLSQLPKIPEVGRVAKLGFNFSIPEEDGDENHSETTPKVDDNENMADEEDNTNQSRTPSPQKSHESESDRNYSEHRSRTFTLTQDLTEPLKQEQDSPLILQIADFYAEEKAFTRMLVAFSCDNQSARAARFVPSWVKKSFQRIHNPYLAFGHEIQRYCMKYVVGFDLSHQIRRIQAARDADERIKRWVTNGHEAVGSRKIHGESMTITDGCWGDSRQIPRECGCDSGYSCAGAGSSSGNNGKSRAMIPDVEVNTEPLSPFSELAGDGEHADTSNSRYNDENARMPAYTYRPPTPPRGSGTSKQLESYGLWQRVTRKDKGKSVDRTVYEPLPGPDVGPGLRDDSNEAPAVAASDTGQMKLDPLPQKYQQKRNSVYDGGPRLPKLDLSDRHSTAPTSEPKTQTMTTTSTFMSATRTQTPTTPRIHMSTPPAGAVSHLFPPRSPPPSLTNKQNEILQNAIGMATEAISDLHQFMIKVEQTYHDTSEWRMECQRRRNEPETDQQRIECYRMSFDPEERAATAQFHQLLASCSDHVTATVLVLQNQTKAVKAVLDAAELLEGQTKTCMNEHPAQRFSLLPSLLRKDKNPELRKASLWMKGSRSGTEATEVDVMMTGSLPLVESPSPSQGLWEKDKPVLEYHDPHGHVCHEPRHVSSDPGLARTMSASLKSNSRRHMTKHSTYPGANAIRPGPKHRPQSPFTRRANTSPPSAGANRDQPPRLSKSKPKAKALPHILTAKWSYACARTEFLALRQMAKFSSLDEYTSPALHRFEQRLERLRDDLLCLDNNRSSYEDGEIGKGSDRGGGSSSSGIAAGDTRKYQRYGSATQPMLTDVGGIESRKENIMNSVAVDPTSHNPDNHTSKHKRRTNSMAKKRKAVDAMRSATATYITAIIARHDGKIGIADTEERVSLNSDEWDWFDSATGKILPGDSEGSRLWVYSDSGSTAPRKHGDGCPYADAGKGVTGGLTGAASGSGTGSGQPSAATSTSTSPKREEARRCSGCGIDLDNTHARSLDDFPRIATSAAGRTNWVRRVLGPRGRKRAAKGCSYHPAFGDLLPSAPSQSRQGDEYSYVGVSDRVPSRDNSRDRRLQGARMPVDVPERGRRRRRLSWTIRKKKSGDSLERDQLERAFIERHRRHTETVARTSWSHFEHREEAPPSPPVEETREGGENDGWVPPHPGLYVGGHSRGMTTRIFFVDDDSGVSLRADDSSGSGGGSGGRARTLPQSATGLARTRSVRSTRSGRSARRQQDRSPLSGADLGASCRSSRLAIGGNNGSNDSGACEQQFGG